MRRTTPDNRAEMVTLYREGHSSPSLALRYGISVAAVCAMLKRRGVVLRSRSDCQKRRELNENAFDVLTPDTCYWIGFLFADGGIHKRAGSPSITLRLSVTDHEHVVKFREFLGSSHQLVRVKAPVNGVGGFVNGKESTQLQVRSSRLVERLESLGMNGLNSAPSPLLTRSRDFWRGVVDGDGSLGLYRRQSSDNFNQRLELVGGRKLLDSFSVFVRAIIPGSVATVRTHKSIFRLQLGGTTATKVAAALYQSCEVCLARKLNAARNLAKYVATDQGETVKTRGRELRKTSQEAGSLEAVNINLPRKNEGRCQATY